MLARVPKAARTDPITGIVFDSAGEMLRYRELQAMEKSGAISELRRQIAFPLFAARIVGDEAFAITAVRLKIRSSGFPNGRMCIITLDFGYVENGAQVYEDWKGLMTEAARLRIAVFEACYATTVRITGPSVMRKGGSKRRAPVSRQHSLTGPIQ